MTTSPSADAITSIRLSSCYLPLATPISDAKVLTGRQKPMTEVAILFAEIRTASGQEGLGFSYSKRAGGPGQFAHAKEIAPTLLGEDPSDIGKLWDKLCWAGASVGRSGLSTQAIGAFDVALWDLKARRAGLSLAKLLGSHRDSVRCYNTSGGFLHTPQAQLLVNAAASVERGIGGIKLKVGQPDGKIDIRSKSGRLGGVKYADYAVGAFIAAAKSKPWFADTVFIFVGDHTAGTSGKVELDPTRYHIMALMYAPELIKPQRYERLMSQIDIGPTLLGLLKTTYRSRFYGKDVLNDRESEPRAFIGIYQKVALVRDGKVAVLGPKREIEGFDGLTRKRLDSVDKTLVDDAIAYYQYASDWIQHSRRIDSRVDGAQ